MVKKIRTRNKVNKKNKKRSLKKMKGGGDQYYFIYSNNPTFSRYNGLLVVGNPGTYRFHSGQQPISNLQKNDLTNYDEKCCLQCISNFRDKNEIMRHLGSYCHTCGVPTS